MGATGCRSSRALVLGLGASGVAAARLLRAQNAAVTAADAADTPELRGRAEALRAAGCVAVLGAAAPPPGDFDLCVTSPGLAANSAWLRLVADRGIPVISELAFGWRHLKARTLAVTGSNGKSTLVKLCAETMTRAGRRACIAGNYGLPVCQVVLDGRQWDWVVLEVSSFQLEFPGGIRPDVAVLLNVYPNHLDRHSDLANYRNLKFRLFAAMGAGNTGIMEPALLRQFGPPASGADWITFGAAPPADLQYRDGWVVTAGGIPAVKLQGTVFDNPVLGAGVAAAAAAMRACGVEWARLAEAARLFVGLPHRLEASGCVRGVRLIDDSKATNVAALCAALQVVPGPLRLIAGGQGKGESFAPALPLLRAKAAGIYLIGRDAPRMADAWRDAVPCRECGTLAAACAAAWQDAVRGDTILLSPACASFDQFRNFEERGRRFREWATKLSERGL